MTNLLLFVALATIIGLIIILAKTFKEKNVLKEDLKESQKTINHLYKQLKNADATIQETQSLNEKQYKQIVEERTKNAKHAEYLQTMQDLTDENNRLKQHIEQLTASIQVNKIETKSKKNRRI